MVAIFSSSEQQNKLSLNKKTLILEYIYTTCGDIVFPDLFEKVKVSKLEDVENDLKKLVADIHYLRLKHKPNISQKPQYL